MEELTPNIAPSTPAPSITPPGVIVEGATPTVTPQAAPLTEAAKKSNTMAFLSNIDWVEAILIVGALVTFISAISYYSNSIKKENSTLDSLTNEISSLQDEVTALHQANSETQKNASGGSPILRL